MKISRLALFAASVHCAEAVNALSVRTTIFDLFIEKGMEYQEYFPPNCEVVALSRANR